MKKIKYIILLSFIPLTQLIAQNSIDPKLENAIRKVSMAQMAIQALYIDTVNVDNLSDEAIKAMLSELDPHTSYTTAEETKKLNEPLNSNFEGIGVQFNILNDTLLVLQTVPKGPSEKVGIREGDRIISVNDTTIAGVKMPRETIMKKLRGPKGTIVNVGIKRRGVDEILKFKIVRDKIPLYSVDASYMIRPKIGYIRISSFAMTTAEELRKAIADLKEQGMKKLILDLQENGGGYLNAATDVASEFIGEDKLLVYTDGRSIPRMKYNSKEGGSFLKGDLAILVNEYTASASEIVSGAVQDYDRGYIIGRRTFGKGLVQRPIELPDGSLIRLTVSHYYTPSGRCIQKPYEKGKKSDYDEDMNNRFKLGELMHADSIHFADSLKCKTLVKGRTIYGGGGIMPDIFVPLDTMIYTTYYRNLSKKNVIINNYLTYSDKNRETLKEKYPNFEDFKINYEIPESLLDSIFAEGKKMKVEPTNEEEVIKTKPKLKLLLKALIARDLWNMSEYFAIVNEDSEIVRKAIETLSKK